VDRYITLLLQQSRLNTRLENHCAAVCAGWFDIVNADGVRTWYNMMTNESSFDAPPGWDDAHERKLQATWNLDMETLILSLCQIRSQQGLKPDWSLPPSIRASISTDQSEAKPATSSHATAASSDVPVSLDESFAEGNYETKQSAHAQFSPSDLAQDDDGNISGSADASDDAVDESEDSENKGRALHQTEMWSQFTQTTPVDFHTPEVESVSYFVDGFSMSGALRTGAQSLISVGVQCSPDTVDASCTATLGSETTHSGLVDGRLQDVDTAVQPHPAQLHDIILHPNKVPCAAFILHHIPFLHFCLTPIADY
jgi:hypothetical protein